MLASQALYHTANPFSLIIFEIGSSIFAWTGLDCSPPTYIPYIAGMIDVRHHRQLFLLRWGVTNLPHIHKHTQTQTVILLISASRGAGSHGT
jgi:hypothetical protein